jgi:Helix-turn-helix domain
VSQYNLCPVLVSELLRGHFRQFSVERLLRLLLALGQDVEIIVRPALAARMKVKAAQLMVTTRVDEGLAAEPSAAAALSTAREGRRSPGLDVVQRLEFPSISSVVYPRQAE